MARLCRAVPASLAMSTRTMTPCCHLKLRWECLGSCPSGRQKLARSTYNARSETASVKRSFREAWKKAQHCIILRWRSMSPTGEQARLFLPNFLPMGGC